MGLRVRDGRVVVDVMLALYHPDGNHPYPSDEVAAAYAPSAVSVEWDA